MSIDLVGREFFKDWYMVFRSEMESNMLLWYIYSRAYANNGGGAFNNKCNFLSKLFRTEKGGVALITTTDYRRGHIDKI